MNNKKAPITLKLNNLITKKFEDSGNKTDRDYEIHKTNPEPEIKTDRPAIKQGERYEAFSYENLLDHKGVIADNSLQKILQIYFSFILFY